MFIFFAPELGSNSLALAGLHEGSMNYCKNQLKFPSA